MRLSLSSLWSPLSDHGRLSPQIGCILLFGLALSCEEKGGLCANETSFAALLGRSDLISGFSASKQSLLCEDCVLSVRLLHGRTSEYRTLGNVIIPSHLLPYPPDDVDAFLTVECRADGVPFLDTLSPYIMRGPSRIVVICLFAL